MERAIKKLQQLSGATLFEEVATGIGHVGNLVDGLDAAAQELSKGGHYHPARVLRNLAEEEAAKILILVDAMRCPRHKQAEGSRTLGYFYSHLAKGIYADVCGWRPADFKEVRTGVDHLRASHYLDGPNDIDWVFPNDITRKREDDLYVGYVSEDDPDAQGRCYWSSPIDDVSDLLEKAWPYSKPSPIIRLVRGLRKAKATSAEGLSVVADIWGRVDAFEEMEFGNLHELNRKTLAALEDRILSTHALHEWRTVILNDWIFPLWPLDLTVQNVSKARLRQIQEQWSPDY